MVEAIIFDFDGVIAESVHIKTEAFRRLFEDYPEQLEQIVDLHVRNGGMSRYEKFKIVYHDFLKQELTAERSAELDRLFSQYSREAVINAPFVRGAQEFLEKYYQAIPLFVVSGTPQYDLDAVIEGRGLKKYFKEIYGSPRKKGELIQLILNDYRYSKDNVIMVGDAINDFIGADQAGVKFVGRLLSEGENPFKDVSFDFLVNDIDHLEQALIENHQIPVLN